MSHQTIYHCDHCGRTTNVDDMIYFHFSSLGDDEYSSTELCRECAEWVKELIRGANIQLTTYREGDD
jgi:hypothetical protein